ncbi:cytochrome C biogenesis protein [Clostridium sp.]|uniref:cytochrome C biogenesis protein n=1 Tax=Clostridium sp. TaxID=1506 RepID=UPI003F2FA20B
MENVKFEIFIPLSFVDRLREEINKTGALTIGTYDNCISISKVTGFWRPLEGSSPYIGETNSLSSEEEAKVEFRCKIELVDLVLSTIKKIHPYDEPVINIIPLLN